MCEVGKRVCVCESVRVSVHGLVLNRHLHCEVSIACWRVMGGLAQMTVI